MITTTDPFTQGRKDYAEGVPGNQNPYTDCAEHDAWLRGWWSGFRDYPPNKEATK